MRSDSADEAALLGELRACRELPTERVTRSEPLAWLSKFEASDEEIARMENTEILIPGILASGHICVMAAEPNAGKTALMLHFAPELVRLGRTVVYINADVGGGDVKELHKHARDHGYRLLLPDITGGSMESVIWHLRESIQRQEDMSGVVFIFDTLKKCAVLINKSSVRELFQLFRRITALGGTVAALAHTNKYTAEDGRPIYEGTGDIRADTDELIFLNPSQDESGNRIISTDVTSDLTKRRVLAKGWNDRTFKIDKDTREITEIGYVDTRELEADRRQRAADSDTIELIRAFIAENDGCSQGEIVEHVTNVTGQKSRQTTRILKGYKGHDWYVQQGFAANRYKYSLDRF